MKTRGEIMEYESLPLILQRYSIEEKINICQKYSRKVMTPTGMSFGKKLAVNPLPWELETFLLCSIKAKEWSYKNFQNKNIFQFNKIINCIRNYQHPVLWKYAGNIKFAELAMIAMGALQFEMQEYNIYKLYRYSYYFNFSNKKIDMSVEFENKFGCKYSELSNLGFTMWMLFAVDIETSTKLLTYVANQYPMAMQNLIITNASNIR